jgi:predicted transcriptional regulator
MKESFLSVLILEKNIFYGLKELESNRHQGSDSAPTAQQSTKKKWRLRAGALTPRSFLLCRKKATWKAVCLGAKLKRYATSMPSKNDQRILRYLGGRKKGKSVQELAGYLLLCETTVRSSIKRLLEKDLVGKYSEGRTTFYFERYQNALQKQTETVQKRIPTTVGTKRTAQEERP